MISFEKILINCKLLMLLFIFNIEEPEAGKAQFEAQSATFATSVIAEVALSFNFYLETLQKLRCELKSLKLVAL